MSLRCNGTPLCVTGRALALAVALAAIVATGGCGYGNAHGTQDLPHVVRITSMPSGAKLILPERKLSLVTPADIEVDLDRTERIRIEKNGYEPFEGNLNELTMVARNTFRVDLVPR